MFDEIADWQVQAFNQARWIQRQLRRRARRELQRIRTRVDPRFRRKAIQKLHNEWVDRHPVAGGVCYALSLEWLSKKLHQHGSVMNRLSRDDKARMVDKALGRQAMVLNISDHEWDQATVRGQARRPAIERYNSASGGMTGRLRLEKVGTVERWQTINKDILAGAIRRCLHQGLIMGYDVNRPVNILTNGTVIYKKCGHAVAWYLSRGTWRLGLWNQHVYLFDSNCGEYRLKLSELDNFVESYLDDVEEAWGADEDDGTHHDAEVLAFGLTAYRAGAPSPVRRRDERNIISGLQRSTAFPGK